MGQQKHLMAQVVMVGHKETVVGQKQPVLKAPGTLQVASLQAPQEQPGVLCRGRGTANVVDEGE